MLQTYRPSGYNWRVQSTTAPSTTPGVSITPAAGSEGSYATLISGANLTYDAYLLRLWFHAGSTAATIRDIIADIGVDPSGGTTVVRNILSDLWVPQAATAVSGGYFMDFPIFVKAGSTILARGRSNSTTAFRCMLWAFGLPTNPEACPVGQYSETIGTSGNGATPVTSGSTGAEGSWTSLGTVTRPLWYVILHTGHNVGTTTAQMYFSELGIGDGSTTGTRSLFGDMPHHNVGTSETTSGYRSYGLANFCEIPGGSTLYGRCSASGTAETVEMSVTGIGG